jgi:hypothetical protein
MAALPSIAVQAGARPIGTISGMSALPVNATATGNTFYDAAHGSFNTCAAHS